MQILSGIDPNLWAEYVCDNLESRTKGMRIWLDCFFDCMSFGKEQDSLHHQGGEVLDWTSRAT